MNVQHFLFVLSPHDLYGPSVHAQAARLFWPMLQALVILILVGEIALKEIGLSKGMYRFITKPILAIKINLILMESGNETIFWKDKDITMTMLVQPHSTFCFLFR